MRPHRPRMSANTIEVLLALAALALMTAAFAVCVVSVLSSA